MTLFNSRNKKLSSKAVIGLGFGDEGKGLVTNALVHHVENPLVVRFSGGQQAGHTVTLPDGQRHVFSNFGSGSYAGAMTYWSSFCTVDPTGFKKERETLIEKGCSPRIYIDRNCPVTTPYDKMANQMAHMTAMPGKRHGTVGVGVGATWQREEDHYSLLVGDLEYPSVVAMKLALIAGYYEIPQDLVKSQAFLIHCEYLLENSVIVDGLPPLYDYIFEGSQGLLLDQDIGFFPHVTRSNTGTKNILTFDKNPEVYLVTRAYQTRHGDGPMTNTTLPLRVAENPKETNQKHEFQGEFRKTVLDLDLLRYGMQRDSYISQFTPKHLVITCCDQMEEFSYTFRGDYFICRDHQHFADDVSTHLGIKSVITAHSPSSLI